MSGTGILFNRFKGYCKQSTFSGVGGTDLDEVVTDGFDLLDWDFDDGDDSKVKKRKKSSFYETFNNPDDDGTTNGNMEMYDNESKTHMNHQTTIKTRAQEAVEVGKTKKLTRRQQRLQRQAEKQPKKQSKKKNIGRNKNELIEYDQPSDPRKVQILNRIYAEIMTLCNKPKSNEKIIQFFDVSIYKDDLDNLKDDQWLSDNNISFVEEYIERYLLSKHSKLVSQAIILLRPSMVYLLANIHDPTELKGVIPALEAPSTRFIFLPINDNDDVTVAEAGSHWSLVVISLLDKVAYVYDTLERANEKEARAVIHQIEKYLGLSHARFNVKINGNTPQQINGSDCGIMVCQLIGFLLSRMLDFESLENGFMDFRMDNVKISAIDGRIFVLGSILNILKHKLAGTDE